MLAVVLLLALHGAGCGSTERYPTTPGHTPAWMQRFVDADSGDLAAVSEATGWTKADEVRLRAGIEALACAEAVPEATNQEEADDILQARTAAHVQSILDEFWAPAVRESVAQDWQAGVAIGANAGRHAPVDCRLHDFRVQDLRWDDRGMIVYVRYQMLRRFLAPNAGAYSGADGWELPNRPLDTGYILELDRGEDGRILTESQHVYKDLVLGDSGI
jgi:hypothetical protein